jgi:hypothetical protein
MSFADRDRRVRVLQALERAIRQFRTREEIWPLRVPAEPLLLEDVFRQALEPNEARIFDPHSLRSRSLLYLKWDDESTWELWIITLASGIKLYCDTSHDESRLLASGRRDSEIETDRLFLELLAESAGETFGIEMSGGPPSRVRSTIERPQLVEFFVSLFEVAGMEEDIRAAVQRREPDFQHDVEKWLDERCGPARGK